MIKKIGVLGGLLTASAITAAAAVPASASQLSPASSARPAPAPHSQPAQYTYSVPGYGATSSGFEQATETTTLVKDTGQFASSYQPFVTLQTSNDSTSPEVELIPTTNSATPADSWNPNGDIGTASATSFFWVQPTPYPAHSACAGNTDSRGCFYAGETVTLTVSYNTGTKIAYMTIADRANGDEYSASYHYASAPSLTTAHLGDVWLQTFPSGGTFAGPQRPKELNSFSSVTLTDTSGRTRPLGEWTHYQRIMTSNGTAKGKTEITPSPLFFNGKSFSLSVR